MDSEETIDAGKYKCTYTCDVTGNVTMEMRMLSKGTSDNPLSICDIKVF